VLLGLITIGFAAFRFAPVLPTGASRNVDKAFFSSVNLATLTGFTQGFASVSDYPLPGLGLIGLIGLVSATLLLAVGATFLARVFGAELSTRKALLWSGGLLVVCSLAGALPGLLQAPSGRVVADAVSAATGLGLLGGRYATASAQTLLVAAGLPASLGIILLLTATARPGRLVRTGLLRGCWIALALVYLLGLVLLRAGGLGWQEASQLSLDARSLGSGFVPPVAGGPTIEWTAMGLMLLGAGPGGVAGGLSVLPIVILIGAARSSLRRGVVEPILGVAVAWIGLFLAALALLVLGLAATQPQLPGDRMLFLAVSALCNVGLSHDPVSLSREGLYLLAGGMLLGRMLPLTMLCWMACACAAGDEGRRSDGE
jgi:hypothetical protein